MTIDLVDFYSRIGNALIEKYKYDQGYNKEYGIQRQRDAYYAVNIGDFEIILIGSRTCSLCGSDAPVPYASIYNRKGHKPNLAYLIAPDTRVPNYTSSLDDCAELANKIGMELLKIPVWPARQNYIEQILTACDAKISERSKQ